MDLLTSLRISASGLAAQKKRVEAINSNIANAQTTRTAEGGPYRRKDVAFGAEPARQNFSEILEGELSEQAQAVHATEVVHSDKVVYKYEPGHVDANSEGYVAYPDINPMVEMANLIEAQRAYESNVTAINTTKAMATKTLEIGRGN
jgi:flagellar basal-body rod protein FlgC